MPKSESTNKLLPKPANNTPLDLQTTLTPGVTTKQNKREAKVDNNSAGDRPGSDCDSRNKISGIDILGWGMESQGTAIGVTGGGLADCGQASSPLGEDYKYKASGTVVRAKILNNDMLDFEIETIEEEQKFSVSNEVVSKAMTLGVSLKIGGKVRGTFDADT